MHRKILVVDGQVGFTGGMNIRAGHWLTRAPAHPVRCVHFRVDGPVVDDMQRAFADDWAFATGEQLEGERWFAPVGRHGPIAARGVPDGPDADIDNILEILLGALSVATRSRPHRHAILPAGQRGCCGPCTSPRCEAST